MTNPNPGLWTDRPRDSSLKMLSHPGHIEQTRHEDRCPDTRTGVQTRGQAFRHEDIHPDTRTGVQTRGQASRYEDRRSNTRTGVQRRAQTSRHEDRRHSCPWTRHIEPVRTSKVQLIKEKIASYRLRADPIMELKLFLNRSNTGQNPD